MEKVWTESKREKEGASWLFNRVGEDRKRWLTGQLSKTANPGMLVEGAT